MRASAVFEEIVDENGPALVQSDSTGGASLFKDMAACPFRAFARHRLEARPLEDADLGLSYRDRGTTVHKALELIWSELGSHARLVELSPNELEALIERGADAAVANSGPASAGISKSGVCKSCCRSGWTSRNRAPNSLVAGIEAERIVSIGGLQVSDCAPIAWTRLPDGREIILDYKTGQLKSRGWEGDRPDEPQLPLYCTTSDSLWPARPSP